MLSSDFNQEIGSLIRRLEAQVREHPNMAADASRTPEWNLDSALDDIEAAIIDLVALHISLRKKHEK